MGEEHRAARERVALFDQSSFAKFEVRGKGAEAALDHVCAGDVTREPGRIAYTQMLNAQGGIECDLTVSRFAPDLYFIVTGTGFRTHDLAWMKRNLPADIEAEMTDVTEQYGCLSLMGPRARAVLKSVTQTDVSNEAFPFGACREIEIAGVRVRALRITYVGELGFELHVPAEGVERVYAALMKAGEAHAISDAGYRAIESLRLEKAYRAWGADIGADTTPDEAGLGFALRKDLGRPFIGRDALLAKRKVPLSRKLAIFTVDDPRIVLLGRETIIRNGEAVGWLTSGGWGYTLATNIGLGYVRSARGVTDEFLAAGDYRLDVAGEEVEARFHARALYDSKGLRPRA